MKKKMQRQSIHWKMFLLIPAWVAICFVFSQLAVALVLALFGLTLDDPISTTLFAVVVYTLTLALVTVVPYKLLRKRRVTRRLLGISRLPNWLDIGLTPPAVIVYLLATALFISFFSWLFPTIDLKEAQEVGFDKLGSNVEYLLAFVTLIVIAPLAEELLFRGYLYGKLRGVASFLPSVIMTSLLFGVAHMQWNVGIDTFALSLVLCSLREITGNIWAGVLLHMLKNGLAFYFIFINPSVLSTLGG